jgi:hypothetical protein
MKKHNVRLAVRLFTPVYAEEPSWQKVLKMCREAEIDEIMFFSTGYSSEPNFLSVEELKTRSALIRRRCAEARSLGLDCSMNVTTILGATQFAGKWRPDWTWMIDQKGKECLGVPCPLDEGFRLYLQEMFSLLGSTGVSRILLDDDLRYEHHGQIDGGAAEYFSVFCFCPLHLAAISQKMGRDVAKDELQDVLRRPDAGNHPLGKIWFDLKRDSIEDMARIVEKSVHASDPAMHVGLMLTFSAAAATGARKVLPLLQALAGPNHPPLLRPGQGWYADYNRTELFFGLPETLLAAHQVPADSYLYAEVDAGGPWNEFYKAYRSTFDFQVKINAACGVKNISLLPFGDFGATDRRVTAIGKTLNSARKEIEAIGSLGIEPRGLAGIQLPYNEEMSRFLPFETMPGWSGQYDHPARLGLPMTFAESLIKILAPNMIQPLRAELPGMFADPGNMILVEGPAACQLVRAGFAEWIGVRAADYEDVPSYEKILPGDPLKAMAGERINIGRFMAKTDFVRWEFLDEKNLTVCSEIIGFNNPNPQPAVAVYRKPGAATVILVPFSFDNTRCLFSDLRKRMLRDLIEYCSGQPLPAFVEDAPDVWVSVHPRTGGGCSVTLINYSFDAAEGATLVLENNRFSKGTISFVGESGDYPVVPNRQIRREQGRIKISLTGSLAIPAMSVKVFFV